MNGFEIDPKSPIPVWAQAKSRLVFLITSGYFKAGEKLPTVRDLAAEFKINYNTVNKAYRSLEQDGYVETIKGKGAFVADKKAYLVEGNIDFLLQDLIEKSAEAGMTGQDLLMKLVAMLRKEGKISEKAASEANEYLRGA